VDRAAAAKIGGMDRETLRDWVHRFNASAPEGLIDNQTEGPKPRLSGNSWLSLRRSWRPPRTAKKMASSAGGAGDLAQRRGIAERFGV
jgi:transposase